MALSGAYATCPALRSLPTAASSRRSNAACAAAAAAARRAKRRGMSAEEKRQTLLGIFHETKDVFTLKVRRWGCLPAVLSCELCCRRSACRPSLRPTARSSSTLRTHASHLQDIEKLGSKRGVVQQSIKDVLQVGAG